MERSPCTRSTRAGADRAGEQSESRTQRDTDAGEAARCRAALPSLFRRVRFPSPARSDVDAQRRSVIATHRGPAQLRATSPRARLAGRQLPSSKRLVSVRLRASAPPPRPGGSGRDPPKVVGCVQLTAGRLNGIPLRQRTWRRRYERQLRVFNSPRRDRGKGRHSSQRVLISHARAGATRSPATPVTSGTRRCS